MLAPSVQALAEYVVLTAIPSASYNVSQPPAVAPTTEFVGVICQKYLLPAQRSTAKQSVSGAVFLPFMTPPIDWLAARVAVVVISLPASSVNPSAATPSTLTV